MRNEPNIYTHIHMYVDTYIQSASNVILCIFYESQTVDVKYIHTYIYIVMNTYVFKMSKLQIIKL